MRSVKDILFEVQDTLPKSSGIFKFGFYYGVIKNLNDIDYALWVLRNHRTSISFMERVKNDFGELSEITGVRLTPNKVPMSFRTIGKLFNISESVARNSYIKLAESIYSTSKEKIDYNIAIEKSVDEGL